MTWPVVIWMTGNDADREEEDEREAEPRAGGERDEADGQEDDRAEDDSAGGQSLEEARVDEEAGYRADAEHGVHEAESACVDVEDVGLEYGGA